MKENCGWCRIIREESDLIIYESEVAVAMLASKPVTLGHIIILPKEHYTIFEQVPDETINELSNLANQISTIIFEKMNITGTNILINNGLAAGQKAPHFRMHIIPRNDEDKLDFTWEPKQLGQEEMSIVEMKIKDSAGSTFDDTEEVSEDESIGDDNPLIEQLNRIP